MGLLYGRAGRLTAKNGGFRPGRAVARRFSAISVEARARAEAELAGRGAAEEAARRKATDDAATVEDLLQAIVGTVAAVIGTARKDEPERTKPQRAPAWRFENAFGNGFWKRCFEAPLRDPQVLVGLGRIVTLYYCSSTLYQIHEHIRCLCF
jgi:hypothetical protein